MILTNCTACAAPLPHLAKQCSRCNTRYCGPACQAQDWKEGGHDKVRKKIKRGGGGEQYHADGKYAEAVELAVEECAEDTKGQTCYICMEAVHRRTNEGLVRGCACHTTEGFVHVSCLVEQAKILREEAVENNLGVNACDAKWARWCTCSLCEQDYHGLVYHALGWACWKTYLTWPETDWTRCMAIGQLGNGLAAAKRHEDTLSLMKITLSTYLRLGAPASTILIVQGNLASMYHLSGQFEEALRLRQDVYSETVKLNGEEHGDSLIAANNYASSLEGLQHFEEARSLLLKKMPVAQRVLGESHDLTLRMRWCYAMALCADDGAAAAEILEETAQTARRVFGPTNPLTEGIELNLREIRAALRKPRSAVGKCATGVVDWGCVV